MPMYTFTDQAGTEHELFMPMSEAVPIGQTYEDPNLGVLTRMPERVGASVEPEWHIKAHSLPPGTPGADHYLPDRTPCFASKRSAEEAAARMGMEFKR